MADFTVEMTLVHPAGGGGVVEIVVHPGWAPLGAQYAPHCKLCALRARHSHL